jgi:hypothetical protein
MIHERERESIFYGEETTAGQGSRCARPYCRGRRGGERTPAGRCGLRRAASAKGSGHAWSGSILVETDRRHVQREMGDRAGRTKPGDVEAQEKSHNLGFFGNEVLTSFSISSLARTQRSSQRRQRQEEKELPPPTTGPDDRGVDLPPPAS